MTDAKHGVDIYFHHTFIRRYAVIANIRYSQMLSYLLNPKDEHEYIWEDSEYPGEYYKDLLSSISLKSLIL